MGCHRGPVDLFLSALPSTRIWSSAFPWTYETVVSAYESCRPGGAVELWMIQGGGHGPDFTDDFGARMVDFLLSHAKPV
jgi:hypothetical protein